MITFTGFTWVQILTLVVSIILPVLVALVTRQTAHPGLKAVVLALLSAATGFLTEWLAAANTGHPYDAGVGALTWLGSFIIAVAVHYGLWKPAGITGTTGGVAAAVPGGIGAPRRGRHEIR